MIKQYHFNITDNKVTRFITGNHYAFNNVIYICARGYLVGIYSSISFHVIDTEKDPEGWTEVRAIEGYRHSA